MTGALGSTIGAMRTSTRVCRAHPFVMNKIEACALQPTFIRLICCCVAQGDKLLGCRAQLHPVVQRGSNSVIRVGRHAAVLEASPRAIPFRNVAV